MAPSYSHGRTAHRTRIVGRSIGGEWFAWEQLQIEVRLL